MQRTGLLLVLLCVAAIGKADAKASFGVSLPRGGQGGSWAAVGRPRGDGKSIWQQQSQQQPQQQPLHFSTRDSRLGFVRKDC